MPPAFYLAPGAWPESVCDTCILDGQEAQHMHHVLRMREGEHVLLLDGVGRQAHCHIEKSSKREARLRVDDIQYFQRPSSLPVMALAFSKATRRGFFMEKAVELGVHEVWLWQGDNSQGRLPREVKEHWQGQCIAAMKQCKNPWLPAVRLLSDGVQGLVEKSAEAEHKFLPWEMQEGRVPMLTANMLGKEGLSVYGIGPEGGFSERELGLLTTANFLPVSLGKRILRCETAALLCLGLHWWASEQKCIHGALHDE